MCVPDLSVLKSVVLGDTQYNLGAIVARRLHNNGLIGDLFGGIYATSVANFLEIPIHEGDMELPPTYLDYDAMVSHQFLERNEQFLQYRLTFDRRCTVHVALPTPGFFDFQAKRRYFITREEANEYERRMEAAASKLQLVRRWLLHPSKTPVTTLDIRQAIRGHRPT